MPRHRQIHDNRKHRHEKVRAQHRAHPMDDVDRPHSMMDSAMKAAVAGAVSYLSSDTIYSAPNATLNNFFGFDNVPLRNAMAATAATTSVINDAARASILGKHGLHLGILEPQVSLIGGAVANMVTTHMFLPGDFKFSNPINNRDSMFRVGAQGALSQAASEYAHLWAVRSKIV